MTRPVERILSGLNKVRNRGNGAWMACCPAHNDKNPSLSIKETPDGDVLMHCFAGCGVDDVLDALGLELADLFSRSACSVAMTAPISGTFTASDVLAALVDDMETVCIELAKAAPDIAIVESTRDHFMDAQDFIQGLA